MTTIIPTPMGRISDLPMHLQPVVAAEFMARMRGKSAKLSSKVMITVEGEDDEDQTNHAIWMVDPRLCLDEIAWELERAGAL